MIIRKLRLQKGWSQEQLAELTGLSVRTIQRLERGQAPSLESARALAAVFEVDISTFHSSTTPSGDDSMTEQTNPSPAVTLEEESALAYVKQLKEFYTHLLLYVVFAVIILWRRGIDDPVVVWGLIGWTIGVAVHALVAYEKLDLFGVGWERRMVEKRLGRKL
jgi:transcriptional regulator with XRE-family HTH domain